MTAVDQYWATMQVRKKPLMSREEVLRRIEWRLNAYPLMRELTQLYGNWTGGHVLDYGCGPGDDVAGFLEYSGAAQVTACDVSGLAIALCKDGANLIGHGNRLQTCKVADGDPRIPLPDDSIAHVNCQGVLQHTSNPDAILSEFRRVLKPGGTATVMVYNRDSLFFHLEVNYARCVRISRYGHLSGDDAFTMATDGNDCPISRAYRPADFLRMISEACLIGYYAGSYYAVSELQFLKLLDEAIKCPDLAKESREFLREVVLREGPFPLYRGKTCGIGGVYQIRRPL